MQQWSNIHQQLGRTKEPVQWGTVKATSLRLRCKQCRLPTVWMALYGTSEDPHVIYVFFYFVCEIVLVHTPYIASYAWSKCRHNRTDGVWNFMIIATLLFHLVPS